MATARPGAPDRKDVNSHQMTVKISEDLYRKLTRHAASLHTQPTTLVRDLIALEVDPPQANVYRADEEKDDEIVIVERDGVYWSSDEWKEGDDPEDPTTAMNAILSTIQMVAFGQYRKKVDDHE
jgi:hypothetical protein